MNNAIKKICCLLCLAFLLMQLCSCSRQNNLESVVEKWDIEIATQSAIALGEHELQNVGFGNLRTEGNFVSDNYIEDYFCIYDNELFCLTSNEAENTWSISSVDVDNFTITKHYSFSAQSQTYVRALNYYFYVGDSHEQWGKNDRDIQKLSAYFFDGVIVFKEDGKTNAFHVDSKEIEYDYTPPSNSVQTTPYIWFLNEKNIAIASPEKPNEKFYISFEDMIQKNQYVAELMKMKHEDDSINISQIEIHWSQENVYVGFSISSKTSWRDRIYVAFCVDFDNQTYDYAGYIKTANSMISMIPIYTTESN